MSAAIRISILANAANAVSGIRSTNQELGTLGRVGSRVGSLLKVGLVGGAVAAGAALTVFGKASVDGATESLRIHRIFTHQLDKMGASGRKAFGDGAKFAGTFGDKIGEDDDRVLAVVNKLSTFPNAFKKGTLGADAMHRATKAAFDLGATGIGSAESNIIGIGKALDNPIKGMTALSKAGVSFSEAEKASITAAVKRGDIAKAQQILLKGIESNAKGAAEAGASGMDRLKARLANVGEELASKLVPKLDHFADILSAKLPGAVEFVKSAFSKITPVITTAFEKIRPAIDALVAAFQENLPGVIAAVKASFAVVGPIIGQFASYLAEHMPAAIAAASSAFGGLIRVLGNPVFQAAAAGVLAFVAAYRTVVAIQGAIAAIRAARLAVLAFNAALLANPVALIIAVIALLVVALVVLWKRSQTAREIMSSAFSGIGQVVLTAAQIMLKGYRFMLDGALTTAGGILKALASIPGPTQENAKKALKSFEGFRAGVDATFDKIDGTLEGYKQSLANLPKKIRLEGDEADLKAKIAQGLSDLKKLPRNKQTVIRAEIADAMAKLDAVRAKLLGIKDRYVSVFISERSRDRATAGRAGGGAFGASSVGANPLSDEIKDLRAGGAAFLTTLEASVGPIVQAGADLAAQLGSAVTKYAADSVSADEAVTDARRALSDVQIGYNRMLSDTAREEARASAETKKARRAVDHAKNAKDRKAANVDLKKALQDERDLIRNNNRTQVDDRKQLNEALAKVDDALSGKAKLRLSNGILLKPGEARKLQEYIRTQTAELQRLADLQDVTTQSLNEATQKLGDAVKARDDFAESISDSIARFGSLLSLDKAEDGTTTTASIIAQFKARGAAAADFARNILGLQAKGLNQTLITELAGAGVESAGSTVAGLLTATPADLAAINAAQADIVASGDRLGKALASTYFDSGVTNAQALVDGLKSKQAEIEATMRALAKAANDAYAKALVTGQAPTASSVLKGLPPAGGTVKAGGVLTINVAGSGSSADAGREIVRQIAAYTRENGPARIEIAP